MTGLTYLNLQHQEHRQWLSQLDFYQDEIKIFQQELMQVLHQHPDYLSIIEHVDEYRRILMKKLQHIDDFRRQLILHERRLGQEPGAEEELQEEHQEMARQVQRFIVDFDAMKKNFRRFVAYND